MDKKQAVEIYQQKQSKKDEIRTALGWSLEQLGVDLSENKQGVSGVFSDCKSIFMDVYRKQSGSGYYFQAKDGGALGQIIHKIKLRINDETGNLPSEEDVVGTFAAMIRNMPQWYRENALTLTAINGNFNALFLKIKNEQRNSNTSYIQAKLDRINSGNPETSA